MSRLPVECEFQTGSERVGPEKTDTDPLFAPSSESPRKLCGRLSMRSPCNEASANLQDRADRPIRPLPSTPAQQTIRREWVGARDTDPPSTRLLERRPLVRRTVFSRSVVERRATDRSSSCNSLSSSSSSWAACAARLPPRSRTGRRIQGDSRSRTLEQRSLRRDWSVRVKEWTRVPPARSSLPSEERAAPGLSFRPMTTRTRSRNR